MVMILMLTDLQKSAGIFILFFFMFGLFSVDLGGVAKENIVMD